MILMHPLTRAEINAKNAQSSTGPRTPEGKAISSQNAVKHGLTASAPFVLPEEQDEYSQFRKSLRLQSEPNGPIEDELFEQMLHASWKMRRIRILEAKVESRAGGEALLDPKLESDLANLARHQARAERTFHRALSELKRLQTERMHRRHAPDDFIHTISPLAASGRVIKQTHLKWNRPGSAPPVGLQDVLAELFGVEKLAKEAAKSASEVPAQ